MELNGEIWTQEGKAKLDKVNAAAEKIELIWSNGNTLMEDR